MMQKRIVIYDLQTMLPRYTCDPPYPDITLKFYLDLADADPSIGVCLSDDTTIFDKCVVLADGVASLADRPEQPVEVSAEGGIVTISNVLLGSKILVDGANSYDLDPGTNVINLATPGSYRFLLTHPPHLDLQFTVEHGTADSQ